MLGCWLGSDDGSLLGFEDGSLLGCLLGLLVGDSVVPWTKTPPARKAAVTREYLNIMLDDFGPKRFVTIEMIVLRKRTQAS